MEIPWERPPGVKPEDTGGTVRTTMEEVLADGQEPRARSQAGSPRGTPAGATALTSPAEEAQGDAHQAQHLVVGGGQVHAHGRCRRGPA